MSRGIDVWIDNMVSQFNSSLWSDVSKSNKAFYGRVYRNERSYDFFSKISPEIWTSGAQYIEVLKDTAKSAQCFFDVEPIQEVSKVVLTAKVRVCFMVNLSAIYPSLTRTEATEKVHYDVQQFLRVSKFEINKLISGFEGFKDYDWGDETQPYSDMHPHYLFRFDTILEYTNNNC